MNRSKSWVQCLCVVLMSCMPLLSVKGHYTWASPSIMTFAFPPLPTTKMISFHGKQSWSFMVICIIVVFSFNMFMCNSLQPEWWPTPYTNLTIQYTNGRTFVSNLNVTLNHLLVEVEHTSQGRFNTSVYGQNPNRIYAFLQCRGDATVYECYNWSRQAKIDAL